MIDVVCIDLLYTPVLGDLWWLQPILDPGFILICAGAPLLGVLCYMALDLLSGTPMQKYRLLPMQETLQLEQDEKRRMWRRMRTWIKAFLGGSIGIAILGLLVTGAMTILNVGIALLVVICSTVVLNAPACALIYLYRAWTWRRARSISQR